MDRVCFIAIVAFCIAPASFASAQRIQPAFRRFEPPGLSLAKRTPTVHASFGGSAPDHRWEGLVVGAVAVGAFGGWAAHGLCADQDTSPHRCFWPTVYGTAFGALVGGVTGGFIGRLFPKRPRDTTVQSPP